MRIPFIAAFLLLPVLARSQAPPAPVRLAVPERICQLTGEIDWLTGQPTQARSFTRFGLDAVDLGYPVEDNDKLFLFFGDAWPPTHGAGPLAAIIPDDAVGVTTRTELPTHESCLEISINSHSENGTAHNIPDA